MEQIINDDKNTIKEVNSLTNNSIDLKYSSSDEEEYISDGDKLCRCRKCLIKRYPDVCDCGKCWPDD